MAGIGMLAHLVLVGQVTFTPTRNPIWGEIRLVLVYVSVMAVWAILSQFLPGSPEEVTYVWPQRIA